MIEQAHVEAGYAVGEHRRLRYRPLPGQRRSALRDRILSRSLGASFLRIRDGGWRNSVSHLVRDNAGHRMSRFARSLHTLGLHACGFGTAQLQVHASGEPHVVQLLGGRREPVVLDVGAFQGDYGLMARQMLGPAAVIHCFEPGASRTTIREKAAGADLNVHCVALGAASGQATLFQDPAIPTMASLHPRALAALDLTPTVSEPVSVTTLDEFCASQGLERVDLLKIDTEGTELDVLRGASRLIANRAIEVIQFEFGYGNVATRTFMRDFYELLGPTHAFYRVAPRGMIALGPYDLALEVFVGATNYAAVARDGTSISATSGVSGAPRSR